MRSRWIPLRSDGGRGRAPLPVLLSIMLLISSGCADEGGASPQPAGPDPAEAPAEPLADATRPARIGETTQSIRDAARDAVRRGVDATEPFSVGTVVAHAISDRVVARARPDPGAEIIERFSHPTDRGGPLVFKAVGEPRGDWIEVLLPVRPNGTTAWVHVDDVELTINPYRIEVDASAYRLTVYRYGREQLSTTIAVGNGATPTPMGDFYLVELLRPSDPDGIYGPFAYGLSGYSDTLDSFNGGEGVIGIHGTDRPDLLGRDVSHGCIRVANPTITELTEFLPLGTPVSIFRNDGTGF